MRRVRVSEDPGPKWNPTLSATKWRCERDLKGLNLHKIKFGVEERIIF